LMNRSEVEMVLQDSSTVADALADIATIGDRLYERIFDERATLRDSLIILRNGSQIEAPGDLTLPLADGDILASSRASLADSGSDKRKRQSLREALSEIETQLLRMPEGKILAPLLERRMAKFSKHSRISQLL